MLRSTDVVAVLPAVLVSAHSGGNPQYIGRSPCHDKGIADNKSSSARWRRQLDTHNMLHLPFKRAMLLFNHGCGASSFGTPPFSAACVSAWDVCPPRYTERKLIPRSQRDDLLYATLVASKQNSNRSINLHDDP